MSVVTAVAVMLVPAVAQSQRAQLEPAARQALREALLKSYAELFDEAPRLEFTAAQIAAMRKILEEAQKNCTTNFRKRADDLGRQLRDEQNRLRADTARIDDTERKKRH
ncbi:MAG: hypothetical protein ACPL7M_02490, partial [Bryobacteraceae bacterium]